MEESCLFPFLGYHPSPDRYDPGPILSNESFDVLGSLVAPGSKILEVGCASGSLLQWLITTKNCSGIGIEPNPDRAALAKEKGLDVLNTYLTKDVLLPNLAFDYVIYADVLEHLPDPSSILMDGLRLLKPGGEFLLSVPNMVHWSIRLDVLRGRVNYAETGLLDATHLRWFTRISIVRYLGYLGFKILKIRYTSGVNLPCYRRNRLLRLIPAGIISSATRQLAHLLPDLFACQIVLSISPK